MEVSESELVGFSSKDPQLDSEVEPSSSVPTHDNDPQPSDLNHLAQADDALGGELQNKLDLKDGDETENKDSNFEAGGGQSCDEAAAPESDKGQGCDDNEGWNGGDEGFDWIEDVNGRVSESDKVDGDETENKDSNFEAGGGQLCDEVAAPESDKGQGCDDNDGWNGGDEGFDWIEDVNGRVSESDKVDGDVDEGDGGEVENKEYRSNGEAQKYPLRPNAEDCAFYLKTGTCKFGFNCKFNHPIRWKNQAVKEKEGEREEPAERSGQTECKYYLRSEGCKFGKACKFNHTRGKCSEAPILELNFLGLPIRLGEKECLYYMRTGSCKYGANCKFNHPDPTAVGGFDSPSGYDTGSSISLLGVSQSPMPSWSSARTSNESAPFVSMILSPTQGVSPQSSEWNGYQAPVYLSERGMHPPSAYAVNNPAIETNVYMHHQKLTPVEEFPERPGEPECSFFLKTGDCKFKSNCKFHHPKNRARLPPCNLSDKGLPLRPDQNVCTHYSRYGICKFGPACRYDHPINPSPSTMPGLDQQFSYTDSSSLEVAGMGGSDGASGATIQQPV